MSTISPGKTEPSAATSPWNWNLSAKIAVSVLLIWHLAALLVGPFSIPRNYFNDYLKPAFRPYLGALYLHHSYKFFAPDPGPSHLIRYELEFADGSRREGVFPNLNEEWPRLFYHRHFMLSEFLNTFGEPPRPAMGQPQGPPPDWADWPLTTIQQQLAQSYADHLAQKYHASSVSLYLREHEIPAPEQVLAGMKLSDPSLYRERKLGTFEGTP